MGGINKVACNPINNNAYAGEFINGTYLPWALSQSDSICSSLATWYGSNNPGTLALGSSTGYWAGQIDKYLALKLIVGTNTYYGWVRLDILASSSSFTIKDYAYESTPNTCIQSGQTVLGMNEYSSNTIFSIFPNPFISSTTIQTTDHLKNASLTICNAYGQPVKQVKNISGQNVSLSRDNLPRGLYFIKLIEANKIIAVEKLMITD
jgi:Secretion system C-terminal sorting domain